jgi:hypothetical protein
VGLAIPFDPAIIETFSERVAAAETWSISVARIAIAEAVKAVLKQAIDVC